MREEMQHHPVVQPMISGEGIQTTYTSDGNEYPVQWQGISYNVVSLGNQDQPVGLLIRTKRTSSPLLLVVDNVDKRQSAGELDAIPSVNESTLLQVSKELTGETLMRERKNSENPKSNIQRFVHKQYPEFY